MSKVKEYWSEHESFTGEDIQASPHRPSGPCVKFGTGEGGFEVESRNRSVGTAGDLYRLLFWSFSGTFSFREE